MRVIDPGHQYALEHLDGNLEELLTFVKREGAGYPGNVGSHPGTNIQEVLRALIDRLKYLHYQIPDYGNIYAIEDLRHALKKMEMRAARRHGRPFPVFMKDLELMPVCQLCGHIGCEGSCAMHRSLVNAAAAPVENSSRSGQPDLVKSESAKPEEPPV